MALVVKDRVKQTTTTTGTGTLTLNGTLDGFQTFAAALSDGDTTYYALLEPSTNNWEVGLGTWTEGSSLLARTTVLASSNSGSAVNLTAQAEVFITQPASKAAFFNADGDLELTRDPQTALQAATKQYVDTIAAAGIHYHDPVRVEHPSNLNATYNNGTAGVGATLTNAGTNAALVLDDVSMTSGDRVLVANQTDQTQNGVYTVTTVGDGSTAWVLTRSTDTDSAGPSDPNAFGKGDAFFIKEGTNNAGHLDVLTTAGTITFGTTNIVFAEVAETSIYSAGNGVTLTGTVFAADAGTGVTVNGSGINIGQAVETTSDVTFNSVAAALTGNVSGNVTGDVTGNADTATALETARNIGGVSFDGTSSINLPGVNTTGNQDTSGNAATATAWATGRTISLTGDVTGSVTGVNGTGNASIATTIQPNSVALGTDTTGNYVATVTSGNYLTGGTSGEGSTPTLNVDATPNNTASKVVARDASGNFSAGTITAALSGNATTASSLATARNIAVTGAVTGNANFDGSGNISISTTATSDPTVTLTGAVTGSGTMTNLGNVSIATTATADPTLTLSGDASGSATFTNLGNATLNVTVADDSHTHDGRYYTESEADSRFAKGQVSIGGTSADSLSVQGFYGNSSQSSNQPIDNNAGTIIHMRGSDGNYKSQLFSYSDGGRLYLRGKHGSSASWSTWQRLFAEDYHPNADKWTTARTLSLTGDASGSTSWDGSGNASISVTVADNSHTHTSLNSVNFNNGALTNVNNLTFNDPGPNEGLEWIGGSGWKIYESPDDLTTNAGGNLQFVQGTTREMTLNTAGSLYTAAQGTLWGSSNDGSGSGLDADTVDGIQASSFLRVDQSATIPDGVRHTYESGGNIATATAYQSSLEVFNNGTGTDAFMSFHVGGDYAAYFGLDGGLNDLAFGGWSRGAASFRVWHQGNDGSGSGLDADLLDSFNSSQSESGNTVAVRNPSGYLFSSYFNGSGTFSTTGATSGMARFTGTNGSDTYGRSYTAQAAATALSGSTMNISGTATNITQYTINQSVGSGNSPSFAGLNINGNLNAVDHIYLAGSLYHEGDTNTYLGFGTDTVYLASGGIDRVIVDNAGVRLGDSGNGYFQPVSGSYGSVQIDGGAHGGWEGYSIGGRAVFMHDNSATMGLFDDVNNQWGLTYSFNGAVNLYYNGSSKLDTLSNGVSINGNLYTDGSNAEDYDALSGTSVTCNVDNAGAFSLTMTGNTTFTFSGADSGWSMGFILQLTGNGGTVTWPSSVKWAGGTAPDAPASGETDILVFHTRDGGTNWYGVLSSDAAA